VVRGSQAFVALNKRKPCASAPVWREIFCIFRAFLMFKNDMVSRMSGERRQKIAARISARNSTEVEGIKKAARMGGFLLCC
jgi:hypothetical protein